MPICKYIKYINIYIYVNIYLHVMKAYDLLIPSAQATPIGSNANSAEMLKVEPGLAHVSSHAFTYLQNMSQKHVSSDDSN